MNQTASRYQNLWLQNYPPGVPPEITFPDEISIVAVMKESLAKFKDLDAFENMGVAMTYEDVDRLSDHFAAFLQTDLGLQKGDRIAIQMPNLLQFPVALFGAFKAGLVVVNTNPLYTSAEMKHQFQDSRATAIVILANFACHLEKILSETSIKHIIVTEVGDLLPAPKRWIVNLAVRIKKMVPAFHLPTAHSFSHCLTRGKGRKLKPVPIAGDDLAFLQYTGGTTGVAKGAMLTHRNVIANMLQMTAWMNPSFKPGEEVIITALPLYHIFSLTVNCLGFMKFGATNILVTNPRDIPAFIRLLQKTPFTVMTGVNTLYNGLMNHPDFQKINFSKLKLSIAGAMALQQAVAERWHKLVGTMIFEGYGLTEASPGVCCNPVDRKTNVGTIGFPLPSTQVKMLDDQGLEAPIGQPGELCVSGPQVMKGYWNRPQETAETIVGGWLHTGDIGVQGEDGFIRIVDRKKDMIIVSGFNVYPNEVEDVLAAHPGVLEVAVVGVPSEKSGEAVKAFVVKKDLTLTDKILMDFCRENLTAYKVPKEIEFRKDLPKTNVGKILRRALRETKAS